MEGQERRRNFRVERPFLMILKSFIPWDPARRLLGREGQRATTLHSRRGIHSGGRGPEIQLQVLLMLLIKLRKFPSIPSLWSVFIRKELWIL